MPAVVIAVSLLAAAFATDLEARPHPLPATNSEAPNSGQEPTFDSARVVPYFTTGTAAEAARLLSDDHAAQALKLLPKDVKTPPERFLRALALFDSGDAAQAALEFERLGPDYPAMRARCDCLAANAFAEIGDLEGAARHEAGCADDPARGRVAKVEHARLLAKLGKTEEAVNELELVVQMPGAQRQEALFAIGQIREQQGRGADAVEAYRDIYLDEPTSFLADKAKQRAKEILKHAKVAPPQPARLVGRIDKLLQAGALKAAISELKDMHDAPVCEGASCPARTCATGTAPTEAGDDEDAPIEAAPAPQPKAFSLASARDDEAWQKTVPLPSCVVPEPAKPADPLSCRVQFLRGLAAKKTRANPKALELLWPVYARCADPDLRARAAFVAAQAAAAMHEPDAEALATIAAFQFADHSLSDDALLTMANIARDRGDRKAERAALRRLISGHPESDQRAEALFRLFWSHRADGHPERGLASLEVLWKEYDAGPRGDGGDAERGRYWWGRTVAQSAIATDQPKGLEMLAALARERPMTYYGLLARSFVASVKPDIDVQPVAGDPLSGPLRTGLLADDRAFTMAVEFLRMGLVREAHESLLAVDFRPLREDGRRGREATLVVLELLRDLGDPRSAHQLARRELLKSLRDATDPLARRASLVAYPLAFHDAIEENATRQGFAPNFLQGLMREESALDPHAKSPVGARGLTQLMPATARAVAKSIGLKRFSVDKLWEPETNIQIGSVYLGRMLKTFGHPGLAAAAYNAGPGAVARWLSSASSVFDEFVENIPFQETRGYVKRVLRSYAAYQYLYEKEQRGVKVNIALKAPPADTTQQTGLR